MKETHYYTKDDRLAYRREPKPGERGYDLTFILEDGDELVVHFGQATMDRIRKSIGYMADTGAEGGAARLV